jgi:hypothetical protein
MFKGLTKQILIGERSRHKIPCPHLKLTIIMPYRHFFIDFILVTLATFKVCTVTDAAVEAFLALSCNEKDIHPS